MNPRSSGNPAGIITLVLLASAAGSFYWATMSGMAAFFGLGAFLAVIAMLTPLSLQIANQWEKAVVLRLGRLRGIRGPGLFFIMPFIDVVTVWIDPTKADRAAVESAVKKLERK